MNGSMRVTIDQMEAWLADPNWEPEPEAISRWNLEFEEGLAEARQFPDWDELQARVHALGARLEFRLTHFTQVRDGLRDELSVQERGNRALKGYGTVNR